VEILAETSTGTIYSDNNKEKNYDDDNNYFPTIEEILYTTLREEGFTTEDLSLETGGSVDNSRSASDNSSGTSQSERAHYPLFLFYLPLTLCR
jgi:hypothetical protein